MNNNFIQLSQLVFLSQCIPWFGKYTGYEQLPKFINRITVKPKIINIKNSIVQRILGKAYSIYRKWPARNSFHTAAELQLAITKFFQPNSIYHILYLEASLPFLDCWQKAPVNLVGTIHLPPAQWHPKMLENLGRLSSAIILYQRDLEFFESYVGKNRIHFIHYGVDIDFFYPLSQEYIKAKRILFAGHYLRNTSMLHRVIVSLTEKHREIQFDLLVPEHARKTDGLLQLLEHPAVTWHKNLSDEALRNLYQTSYILLLPMNNSGANTAIVEALSCGLPIVTTDVGGVRDYGGADIYPIVANDDDQAMIDLIEKYIANPDWRKEIANSCRRFAEQKLAWPIVAQKHSEIYKKLA